MNDADRHQSRESPEDAIAPDEPVSRYEVVPYAEIAKDEDLYSFRAQIATPQPVQRHGPVQTPQQQPQSQPQADEQTQQQPVSSRKNVALLAGIGGGVLLFVVLLVIVLANKQQTALPFIDLGPKNIAAAGLGARLIAKWDGKAEYELHIDPTVPQQIAAFSIVAGNPPYPLSVNLRLKDAFGSVLCQREILFPFNPAAAGDPDKVQPLLPEQTSDGDTVQNVAGADGQIAEIVVSGQLLCPVKLYNRLASWDFSSSFPAVADQQEWMRHEQGVSAELKRRAAELRARALIPRARPLSAPIDGDDVIVFDNPSRGTVETRAGRLFYLVGKGLRARAPGWQVFPAAIHFHCDIKANCILTRPDAATPLQARLVH